MADPSLKHDIHDRTRIDVRLEHELAYWSARFGVTRDALRGAVQAAGPLAVSVERHLRKQDGERVLAPETS